MNTCYHNYIKIICIKHSLLEAIIVYKGLSLLLLQLVIWNNVTVCKQIIIN